jgi:hypothetical protein
MANLIVELMQEILRVERLPEGSLDVNQRAFAFNVLRSAETHLSMNSYEGMRESLDELREIGRTKKKPDSQ